MSTLKVTTTMQVYCTSIGLQSIMQCFYWQVTTLYLEAPFKLLLSQAQSRWAPLSMQTSLVTWPWLFLIWIASPQSFNNRLTLQTLPWKTWNCLQRSRQESFHICNISSKLWRTKMNCRLSSIWFLLHLRRRWLASFLWEHSIWIQFFHWIPPTRSLWFKR